MRPFGMLLAEDLTQLDEILLVLFDARLQKYVLLWHVWVLFINDSHGVLARLAELFLLALGNDFLLVSFAVLSGTLHNS